MENIQQMIEEYRRCSEICSDTDYGNKKSVEKRNRAVTRMYEIVQKFVFAEHHDIRKLACLLDEPASAPWLAHQLVETAGLPKDLEDKCFMIIEGLATCDGPDAMGERMWLDEWRKKKGRV